MTDRVDGGRAAKDRGIESGNDGKIGDQGEEGETEDDDTGKSRTDGRPCPLCEAPMYRRHCKYVCPRHGVVYDCSDTFWI